MSQSILFNSAIAFIGRLATLIIGLVATALTTRLLGAEAFGQYSFVATIGIFLQLLADFGLYLTASHELGQSRSHSGVFGHIVSLRGLFLLIVYGSGCVLFIAIDDLRIFAPLFAVLAIGFSVQSLSQLFMSVFQAYGVVWRATISDILGRVAQVSVLILLYVYSAGSSSVLIAVAGAFSIGLSVALVAQVFLIPHKRYLLPSVSPMAWRKIVAVSWPIGALLVLNVIYFRIDTVMLTMFRSAQEVGLYALAYRIIENTLFFPAMLGGLALPHISSALKRRDALLARGIIEQAVFLSLSFAVPITALLVLFSQDIVTLISGRSFAGASSILVVLALAGGIMFVGNILGFALIALQRQRDLLVVYAILAVGNITANYVFIPRFGALGASWVTVVTEGCATIIASFLVYRYISWRLPYQQVWSIAFSIACAVGVGTFLPTSIPFLVRAVCVCAVYGILGYTNGIWSLSSTSLLRTAKHI